MMGARQSEERQRRAAYIAANNGLVHDLQTEIRGLKESKSPLHYLFARKLEEMLEKRRESIRRSL